MDPILVFDDYRKGHDDALDHALITEIGQILATNFPAWQWYVEAPPGQNVVIIRNLDFLAVGTNQPYCMAQHKNALSGGNIRKEIIRAGGEMIERYQRHRRHFGRFGPEDLAGQILIKPEL